MHSCAGAETSPLSLYYSTLVERVVRVGLDELGLGKLVPVDTGTG